MENTKQIEILNDLIQVNNDRIAGYERAMDELKEAQDEDLIVFFNKMADDSRDYHTQLARLVEMMEGTIASGNSGAGKVYRVWMDFKALLTDGERGTVLDNVENVEAGTIRAYESALATTELAASLKEVVRLQYTQIGQAYDQIRAMKKATGL